MFTHTHMHTHVPHIDFHCNIGGVAPTCTYTACSVSGATNTSRVHSKSGGGGGGGGVYIIIGDQTLPKGGVSPRKVPYPIPHIILDQQAIWIVDSGVALATPTGCAGLYQYVRCKQL